jgi:hypothetical protein
LLVRSRRCGQGLGRTRFASGGTALASQMQFSVFG